MMGRLGENGGVNSLVAQFQLQYDDWKAFGRFANGNKSGAATPRIIRTLFVLFSLLLIAGVVFRASLPPARPISYAPTSSGASSWSTLLALVLPVVIFGVIYALALQTNKKARIESPIFRHPNTVTLATSDIRSECGPTTTTVRWQGISRVANTPQHLFIFTQPKNAFIVPRRAFDSDEEFARFADFARAHCEAAKPQTPPIAEV